MAGYPLRKYEIEGPDVDKLDVHETAKYFGLSARTWREMIEQGRVPRPLGVGNNEYYLGPDIAVIRLMLGRWSPAEPCSAAVPKRQEKRKKDEEQSPEEAQEQ